MTREIDWGDLEDHKHATLPHKIAEAIGGGALGLAQGVSDVGANIAQFPSDIYSYFTGKEGYKAPKPNFREYTPSSSIGRHAERIGEFIAPFAASPALAAETALGRAMFGGKLLPRLGLDALLGASESEDRKLGAAFGAAAPAAGRAIKFVKETPLTAKGASKKLEKARKLAGEKELNIPMSVDFLRNIEYQMQSPHLKPSKMQINTLMGNAAKGDYPSYFAMQSALGDIGRELMYPTQQKGKGLLGFIGNYLSPPQTSAAERLTGQQIDQLRKQYISEAMEHLNKTGKGKIAKLESKGRQEYSNYKNFAPVRNKIALGLLAGIPGYKYIQHVLDNG